jgi:hypothetical protein
MKTTTPFTLTRITLALALAGSTVLAQAEMSNAAFDGAKDQIKAAYKAERDACDSLAGNTKDICVETAKGREKVALAHLQVQRSGAPKDQTKLAEARFEARYDVAKEKCDDQAGNAKDVCVKQAKAEHEKAKADVKMNKEIRESRSDAEETKMKADYKVAAERCDTLSGDAKDACVATAKARFGM